MYKRQVYVLAGVAVFAFGFAGSRAGALKLAGTLGKVLTAPAKLLFKMTGTTADSGVTEEEPVSYTHLDVYKRQR